MKFFITGRGGGKTHKLLQWRALSDHNYILVSSAAQAENLRETIRATRVDDARTLGLKVEINKSDNERVVTVAQLTNGALRGHTRRARISIDEIEMVLPQLLANAACLAEIDIVTGTVNMMGPT